MGCDAHMYVEMVTDGKWQYVNPPFNEKCLGEDRDEEWGREYYDRHKYDSAVFGSPEMRWNFWQCYYAFALLAGVRNRWDVVPLAPKRGIPFDVSPEVKVIADNENDWSHSHTHFTLEELRTLRGKDGNIDALINVLDQNKGDHKDSDVRVIVWFDS